MKVNGMVEKNRGEKNINVEEISVFLRKEMQVKETTAQNWVLCMGCSGEVSYSALHCLLGSQRGDKRSVSRSNEKY